MYKESADEIIITPCAWLTQTTIYDYEPRHLKDCHALDEYNLLKKLRTCRLLDTFVGYSCHSTRSKVRTTIDSLGYFSADDIYFGIHRNFGKVVIPVMAVGWQIPLKMASIAQQLQAYSAEFLPLPIIPAVAQFIEDNLIALFSFEYNEDQLTVSAERHYRIVHTDELAIENLGAYRTRTI